MAIGTVAGTGAASGSDRGPPSIGRNLEKPLDSGGFFASPITGKTPAGLLDIGGSLC
jgi:hypothetical protein